MTPHCPVYIKKYKKHQNYFQKKFSKFIIKIIRIMSKYKFKMKNSEVVS
jgi:hypothetical protein